MNRLRFFRVKEEYSDRLRSVNPHVTVNDDSHVNTYVGILFEIEGVEYIAPLTHTTKDRRWHQVPINITNVQGEIVNSLGTILLHNMIPVYSDVYEEVDVDGLENSDKARYLLYQEQLYWMNISSNRDMIINSAENVRRIYTNPAHHQHNYLKRLLKCTLTELESEMIAYKEGL